MTDQDERSSCIESWKLPDTIGMEIYDIRMYEGLTQKEMARKLGIAVITLSKVENGHLNISKTSREKIEQYVERF